MIALRLSKPLYLPRAWPSSRFHQHRGLRNSELGNNKKKARSGAHPQRLSLLDELFPEKGSTNKDDSKTRSRDVPRLTLPEVDDFFEEFDDENNPSGRRSSKVTQGAVADAFRHQKIAVLALEIASKSLIESDFRRIAPKGKHIDDWTGPGDILKVIPARDPNTLDQLSKYFILFPNPAYARTYQNHVVHLHRVARTHTPTSIESPLPIQPGVILEGEDVYTLLQDYALCPPSQRLQLRLMYPSYTSSMKLILQEHGYPQLLEGDDRTGRSVLFMVVGQQVTTHMVRNTIAADGRQRGLAWNVSVEKLNTLQSAQDEPGSENNDSDGSAGAELEPQRYVAPRWILVFKDENEARRFIRTWHRRPFPFRQGDGSRLVHAELLW